jgi:hypothetical protein
MSAAKNNNDKDSKEHPVLDKTAMRSLAKVAAAAAAANPPPTPPSPASESEDTAPEDTDDAESEDTAPEDTDDDDKKKPDGIAKFSFTGITYEVDPKLGVQETDGKQLEGAIIATLDALLAHIYLSRASTVSAEDMEEDFDDLNNDYVGNVLEEAHEDLPRDRYDLEVVTQAAFQIVRQICDQLIKLFKGANLTHLPSVRYIWAVLCLEMRIPVRPVFELGHGVQWPAEVKHMEAGSDSLRSYLSKVRAEYVPENAEDDFPLVKIAAERKAKAEAKRKAKAEAKRSDGDKPSKRAKTE